MTAPPPWRTAGSPPLPPPLFFLSTDRVGVGSNNVSYTSVDARRKFDVSRISIASTANYSIMVRSTLCFDRGRAKIKKLKIKAKQQTSSQTPPPFVSSSSSPPPPPPPPPSTTTGTSRTTFPDPLKQYVARTFEDVSPEDKKDVEAELKRIITDAFNEKVVWSIDWDKMPLPQVILARKRAAQGRERSSGAGFVSSINSSSCSSPSSSSSTTTTTATTTTTTTTATTTAAAAITTSPTVKPFGKFSIKRKRLVNLLRPFSSRQVFSRWG